MSAELDNILRIVLWVALIVILFLNYRAWQDDYARLSNRLASAAAAQPRSVLATAPPMTARQAGAKTRAVHVRTDVVDIDIDLLGGTLRRADLLRYPRVKGSPEPVRLLNQDSPDTRFELHSGLTGPGESPHPTHLAQLTSAADSFQLANGANELRVPLQWQDENGVTVTKTYVFHRGNYRIDIEYRIENHSSAPWIAAPYAQILRDDPKVDGSMFKAETRAFRGPALYDGHKYRKLNIEDAVDAHYSQDVTDGWIAALQHHFVAAIVPSPATPYRFTLATQGREYSLSAAGPESRVAPGATAKVATTLFVGPKLQKELAETGPSLELVADYGVFTPIAKPLFWLLSRIHDVVGNWGWAIVIGTALLKIVFYPLAEKSGRSMAKIKALAPRIKELQELHKDNREALAHATLELYQREKVSPVSGCLPTLTQFPVWAALYWVLLESVEMRQAPFMGWLTDLSAPDPYFILPAIMAGAMFLQMKLQGSASVDPLQRKIFMIMPVVMSLTFALFPAGLVLYYVVNTLLSMAQQWNINRRLQPAAA